LTNFYNGTFGPSQDHFCVGFEAFSQLLKGLKIGTQPSVKHVVIGGDEALIIPRNSLLFRLILLRIGSVLGSFLGF
jgi:hypothetical protein